jgi:hypothetical protein
MSTTPGDIIDEDMSDPTQPWPDPAQTPVPPVGATSIPPKKLPKKSLGGGSRRPQSAPLGGAVAGEKRARMGSSTVAPTPEPILETVTNEIIARARPDPITQPGEEYLFLVGGGPDAPTEGRLAFSDDLYTGMADALAQCRDDQLPYRNAVFTRLISAHPDDNWLLWKAAYKPLDGCHEPGVYEYAHPHADARIYQVTTQPRNKKEPTLIQSDALAWRIHGGRSFVIFGPVTAFWPPPLTTGPAPGNDLVWMFKIQDQFVENERDVLEALNLCLKKHYVGCFFAVVRLSPLELVHFLICS